MWKVNMNDLLGLAASAVRTKTLTGFSPSLWSIKHRLSNIMIHFFKCNENWNIDNHLNILGGKKKEYMESTEKKVK